jgi:hypothetical protein
MPFGKPVPAAATITINGGSLSRSEHAEIDK